MVIGTITAPAFAPAPPRLVNVDGIAPAIRARQLAAWLSGDQRETELHVQRYQECWPARRGLIIGDDGSILSEGIHNEAEIVEARAAIRAARDPPRLEGPHVLLKHPGQSAWGHWLIEILPILDAIKPFVGPTYRIAVPRLVEPEATIYRDSLIALGAKPESISPLREVVFRCNELLTIQDFAVTGERVSPTARRALRQVATDIEPAHHERIFLSRQSHQARRIANFEQLLPVLDRFGFTIIEPQRHSFTDQVAFAKGAQMITGVMGSALANMAFMPLGGRVLALAPEKMTDTFFWRIAALFGHGYYEMRCPSVGAEPVRNRSWDREIFVDPDGLGHWLSHVVD